MKVVEVAMVGWRMLRLCPDSPHQGYISVRFGQAPSKLYPTSFKGFSQMTSYVKD